MQLLAGVFGRLRPLRGDASHADGPCVRSAGHVAVRCPRLRHLGGVRRPFVHGVHPQLVHDQRRSLLGHHSAAGLRRQTDARPDVFLRRPRLDLVRLHLFAAAARPRQRPRPGRRRAVPSVPRAQLPNLRYSQLLLLSIVRHGGRLLSDLPGGQADRRRRKEVAEPFVDDQ